MAFAVAPGAIDDLLVKDQVASETPMILRVKKPDFIGSSMWDFIFDGRTLSVRVNDADWLTAFRSGGVILQPGDSLRALVRSTVRYGFDNEVVGSQYEILKVVEVLSSHRLHQKLLDTQ
jgi:hypothetical protein